VTRVVNLKHACAAAVVLLLAPTARAQEPTDRLLQWLAAVEAHEPGNAGKVALDVSQWPGVELEEVIQEARRYARAFDKTRQDDANALLLRGAVLHADIARLISDDFERRSPKQQRIFIVSDGREQGTRFVSLHWELGRSLLILFSDGVDTASWLSADSVLETARRGDVVVYVVEIGGRRTGFTRDLSEVTGGRLISVESTKDLSATFTGILEEFRMRYLISYSPQAVSAEGWHRLEVRARGRGLTVKARPGYFAAP